MWNTISTQHCVKALSSHWQDSADFSVEFGTLGAWRPIDLLRAVRSNDDFDRRDAIARELVHLAKVGHAAADQLLLVAMLPRVIHLTRTCRALVTMPVRDAQAVALGAMWEAIRIHPDSESRAVLHRLGMDALGIITRTHTALSTSPEYPTSPEIVDELHESASTDPCASTIEDLAEVLKWGLEASVITREDIRVIAAVDLGTPDDRRDLAAEFNVAVSSLVRRAHRIRTRLRGAIANEIAEFGQW